MDTLIEALLDRPDLVIKLDAIENELRKERQRRERFYVEMTPSDKIEFINGQVVMHSPAKWRHAGASGRLYQLLTAYSVPRKLGAAGIEKLLISLTRNDYEPDVCFFRQEVAEKFTEDQMRFPAPDFVAEVLSPSTERTDRSIKMRDYGAHGVAEYWIVDADARTVEQYVLRGSEYDLRGTWKEDDWIVSTSVAGFRVPARAIFDQEVSHATLLSLAVVGTQ